MNEIFPWLFFSPEGFTVRLPFGCNRSIDFKILGSGNVGSVSPMAASSRWTGTVCWGKFSIGNRR